MLEISATVFFFILEILLIVACIAALFYIRNKRLKQKETRLEENVQNLEVRLEDESRKVTELKGWKQEFDKLQQKFEHIKIINNKLHALIASLVPNAEKSKELQQLLSDSELTNKELDACLGSLLHENKQLDSQLDEYKDEIIRLKKELDNSVSKSMFEALEKEKNRLSLKAKNLEKKLKETTADYEKLEKEHVWLEKEYNALYENINDDNVASHENPS